MAKAGAQIQTSWRLEAEHWQAGHTRVAGVDEAGRGAWAGPLVVAAVVLPPDGLERPYRDSKLLSAKRREVLARAIRAEALAWAVVVIEVAELDVLGVGQASVRGGERAVRGLVPGAQAVISDYLALELGLPLLAPPKADAQSYSVAAAAILAKTSRDQAMLELHQAFPHYGFAEHQGYGTASHRRALAEHGVLACHRRSFSPISTLLSQAGLFNGPSY
jgi:ribonuclease HII